jgi:hypothetical protein
MRKFTLLMLVLLGCLHAQTQDKPNEPAKTGKRFFVGISYSYFDVDTKLSDLTLHSVWAGEDFGTLDLTSDEISEINSYAERNNRFNDINIEAGMKIFDRPGSKWRVSGVLSVGLAKFYSKVINTATDTVEYTFNSDFFKPTFGLGFKVSYLFNPHWGLSLRPLFVSTFGTITDIEDNVNPVPVNVTQTPKDQYYSFYERVSLTADFTTGPVTIAAGPGFYWANSRHKYTIDRTNDLNGETYLEEITTWTRSRAFFDGNIALDWRIIEPLTFYAMAGIGADLLVSTGLRFNF